MTLKDGRFQYADWVGPVPGHTVNGMEYPLMGCVAHIEEGTETGTDSWFHNGKSHVSSHFGNPLHGNLQQFVSLLDEAWAEVDGNRRWVSIEFEGFSGKAPAPTANQIENAAHLLAHLHVVYKVPLQVTNSPSRPGLGWHGMGGRSWGDHLDCPGPRIKAARPRMLRLARQIVDNQM